ncbi:type 4 pilus major pilin [Streptomyces tendae]|uniref:type 4 pilus major pilin n=1 Tax=Streptomyces tendae TaxID=1932 RepID=UPI000516423E
MAKWWKFGLGKKDQEEGPAPEEQAPAPAPEPAPQAPEPSAGGEGGGEKKRGLLGRLFGRGRKKEKAPAPEAPPAAPPSAPPSAPPAAPPSAPAEGGEEAGGGGPAGPAKPSERTFPSRIDATADGDWVISANEWYGQMNATLSGNKAKSFILAYEANDWSECAQLIADGWNMPVASQINVGSSNIENISWN